MISRPTLSCSHWREFVCTECRHDVIVWVSIATFKTQRHISSFEEEVVDFIACPLLAFLGCAVIRVSQGDKRPLMSKFS